MVYKQNIKIINGKILAYNIGRYIYFKMNKGGTNKMTTPEGYIITCNSYMGDSEDLILSMTITFLDGTKKTESRYTKANKKRYCQNFNIRY